ncbi:MAG: menaquinone biosynthetic enzyme MqnA/MqnD family protein [Ferruginibacter sp.]
MMLMGSKIRIGAVSYLNTKPMTFHFEQGFMQDRIDFSYDHPAVLATQLQNGLIDLGLVPIAVLPSLDNPSIISDFCISTDGEVASVCLFSNTPLESVDTILLDYQSRSSVGLLRVLLHHFWKLHPTLIQTAPGYEETIQGTTAGLIIGDRALRFRNQTAYCYDLGAAWKAFTGLPFVFAAWIATQPLPETFIQSFNEGLAVGLSKMDQCIQSLAFDAYDLNVYYKKNIEYTLNDRKREAIQKYLTLLDALDR